MQLVMSNPGLHLAVIGNPGPRTKRRSKTRRTKSTRSKSMATMKQKRAWAKNLRKARAAQKRKSTRRNPSSKQLAALRKGRMARRRKTLNKRRKIASSKRRRLGPSYKVIVRRKAGKRKANKRWGDRMGLKTGRKGTISYRKRRSNKLVATNPRRRRKSRKSYRRNPPLSVSSWKEGVTGLPKNLTGMFKGKDMVKNVAFATGGMLGGMVIGGMVRGTVMGAVANFAPGLANNRIMQGVLGGTITYTSGYVIGQMLIKDQRSRTAFITGSAAAAIINALMPGAVNRLLTSIPVLGPQLAMLPGMSGLGAYVAAPGYQAVGGMGAYVSAPGYQAVGDYADELAYYGDDAVAGIGYSDDALAGELGTYVEAPSYQAVGDLGMYGASHLDQ